MAISSRDTFTGLCITFAGKTNVYPTQTGTDQQHTKEVNPNKSGLVSQEIHCGYLQEWKWGVIYRCVGDSVRCNITSPTPPQHGWLLTNAASLEFPAPLTDSTSSKELLPPLRLSTVSLTRGKEGSWLLLFLGDLLASLVVS